MVHLHRVCGGSKAKVEVVGAVARVEVCGKYLRQQQQLRAELGYGGQQSRLPHRPPPCTVALDTYADVSSVWCGVLVFLAGNFHCMQRGLFVCCVITLFHAMRWGSADP